jgi:integrase
MRFQFEKRQICESTRTTIKSLAQEIETNRRKNLALATHGMVKKARKLPPGFTAAADAWLNSKTKLTPLGRTFYAQYVRKLSRYFGNRLVSDITAEGITALQKTRRDEELSGRQINCEINTLRAILQHCKVWSALLERADGGKIEMLDERTDVGRALSPDEEARLLDASAESPSPALYPMFILSLDAGLRPTEIRRLRRENLDLCWRAGAIESGRVRVGISKTEASSGRSVPLTRRACGALTLWLSRFPDGHAKSFVFPFHRVGFAGNGRKPHVWAVDLDRPASRSNYKRSFETACSRASVECRFYDGRHTFITKLAENSAVSEETIRQLAGHVSKEMLKRYAHVRDKARQEAISILEGPIAPSNASVRENLAQKLLQSSDLPEPLLN